MGEADQRWGQPTEARRRSWQGAERSAVQAEYRARWEEERARHPAAFCINAKNAAAQRNSNAASQGVDQVVGATTPIPQQNSVARPAITAATGSVAQTTLVIDEIQTALQLLERLRFVLTGSSSRKLRHGASNLLGGRLVVAHMSHVMAAELGESFSLDKALRTGLVPLLRPETNPEGK